MSRRRPGLVTILALGVLTLGAVHLAGFLVTFSLPEMPISVPLWYLRLKSALWGLSAATAGAGVFLGRRWAPAFTRWGAAMYLVWLWADRLLLATSPYARQSLPFALVLSLGGLGSILWILGRKSAKDFFGET
jgi:hypothetical protein